MKVLNRPMFRYGGPIKEGIMSGIKEPRQGYRDRPSLVIKNDPMKMQIDRFLTNQNNASNASKVFENVSKTIQDNKLNNNQVSNIENIFKNNNQFGNQDPNKIKNVTIEDKIKSYTPNPENPFRDILDYTEKLNVYVDEDGVKRNRNTGKIVMDTETIETGKATGTEMPPMLDQSGKMGAIDEVIKNKGKGGDDDPPPATKKERVNTILESLGYDRAQKNALYDAMIKAGQRISRTGLSADNLVSDVIAETSQSYDKPEKLREAANLMDVQQQLKLDQIEASKDTRSPIQKNADYFLESGVAENTNDAIRMARNLPVTVSETFQTKVKEFGKSGGLDQTAIDLSERGQFGKLKFEGKVNKKYKGKPLSEFLGSAGFKGDGVYTADGKILVIENGVIKQTIVVRGSVEDSLFNFGGED